jgi:hypothetical protein
MLSHLRQTYFDAERPRTDPIVSLNVLRLFYSRGRGHEVAPTLEWVLGVLEHRAYLEGTRYYESAECFLFFAAQLLRATPDATLHARLAPLLRSRILERSGAAGDALALSMRVLAGTVVDLRLEPELALLLPLQCEDGSWGPGWIYKYGSSGIKIGNRGLTTAFALNAISALQPPPTPPQPHAPPLQPLSRPESSLPPPKERATLPKSEPEPPLSLQLRPPRPAIGRPAASLRIPAMHGLSSPSPPPSMSPGGWANKEWRFSAGAIAKDLYTYLFATARTNPRRRVQDVGVGVRRHKRGSSIGIGARYMGE